ncbi:RNA-directed DNA polymerase, eukaryota [Tanacetum coccineum]
MCPLCNAAMEDVQHVFFRCDVARVVLRKICRWWDLDWQEICSFSDWDAWFLSFRLSSRLKSILEGVFYVAWWRIWRLRNRRNFFYGSNGLDTKITWVKWSKILAAKKCGGLGVSSYFALNRALLFKWVWRFISFEKSCWSRVIHAIHGPYFTQNPPRFGSVWGTIVREIQSLNSQGIDLLSFCRIRVGNGLQTRFWKDHWIGDAPLYDLFPRLFSLEMSGDVTVATKLHGLLSDSFRRPVRGGIEAQQLAHLQNLVGTSILSNSDDRWVCNLNGDGSFQVKNIRCLLDEYFLPNDPVATRWVKFIPIKINVFAWRVYLDRLPTRLNLNRRNIQVLDQSCPVCKDAAEEVSHLFFSCPLAVDVHRLICRWWNLTWSPLSSYEEWLSWFKDIRLGSILKCMLEVVSGKEIHRNVTYVGSAPKVPFATPFAAKGFDKKDL